MLFFLSIYIITKLYRKGRLFCSFILFKKNEILKKNYQ
nr:MAG TPA: hypothetical protein [Bacteriophage sp.]